MPMTAAQKVKAKEVQAAITEAIKAGKPTQEVLAVISKHFPGRRLTDLDDQLRDIDHEIALRKLDEECDDEFAV